MLESVLCIMARVMLILYAISFPMAIILLVLREGQNIHTEDAPNPFIGILFHFITIWAICPFFLVYLIINKISKKLS